MDPQETGRQPAFLRPMRQAHAALAARSRRDKGSMLLEAVVSLGLLSALTLGYTVSSTNADVVQRQAVNATIASQVTQNALETARSTPWSKIGTTTAPVGGLLPVGTVHLAGSLTSSKTVTSRGLKLTVNTAAQWTKQTSSTGYGTKKIVIKVSWQDKLGDPSTLRTRLEPILITPGIGEAAPSKVRAGSEGTVPKAPAMPVISQRLTLGPTLGVLWPAVTGADSYILDYRANNGSWASVTTTSLSYQVTGRSGDLMEIRVRASGPAGISLHSNIIAKNLTGS